MPGSTNRLIPFLVGGDAVAQIFAVSSAAAQRINDLIVALEGRMGAQETIPRVRSFLASSVAKGSTLDSWAVLAFTANSYLSGASMRPAPTRFAAPITGIYSFHAKIVYDANVSGRRLIRVRRNSVGVIGGGTELYADERTGTTGNTVLLAADQIGMTAGDYIEVFTAHNAGTTINILGGNAATYCALTYINPVP